MLPYRQVVGLRFQVVDNVGSPAPANQSSPLSPLCCHQLPDAKCFVSDAIGRVRPAHVSKVGTKAHLYIDDLETRTPGGVQYARDVRHYRSDRGDWDSSAREHSPRRPEIVLHVYYN